MPDKFEAPALSDDEFIGMKMLTRFKLLKRVDKNKPHPDIGWMIELHDAARSAELQIFSRQKTEVKMTDVKDEDFAWLMMLEDHVDLCAKHNEPTVSLVMPLHLIPIAISYFKGRNGLVLRENRGNRLGQKLTFRFPVLEPAEQQAAATIEDRRRL